MKKKLNHVKLFSSGLTKKIGILILGILFIPIVMMATHFRYGSISWTNASSNTVVFKLQQSWRLNYPWGVPISVGSVLNVSAIGTSDFSFGDGNNADILLTVTSVNPGGNSFFGEATLTHTYASSGNFTAFYASAARISSLVNNPDGNYRLATTVNVGSGNSSPVSTIIPIVDVAVNNPGYVFNVPAVDPNGSPLSFRFSTSAEAGPGFVQPVGLSINSSTGQMTFNTVGKIIGQLYTTQIMISDGAVEVPLDFIIRISSTVGAPPSFVYPPTPANSSTLNVVAGQTLTFNLEATDVDLGDVVSLSAVGVPVGATFSPSLPASGNPVMSTFSWATTLANVGTYVVNFNAQDNTLQSANTSVTITVIPCNITLSANITNVICKGGNTGAIDLTITGANGTSDILWSNGATTEDISGLTAGSYTFTITDDYGCTESATYVITEPTSAISCTIGVSPAITVGGHAANTIYLGYGPQSVTLSASASGGLPSYSYSWGSAGVGASVVVSPTTTTTYILTVIDANNCETTCSVIINVVDVRCGNKLDKVLVCHRTNGVNMWNNICISSNAVATHLAHGDYLGICTSTSRESVNVSKNEMEEDVKVVPLNVKVSPNPSKSYFTLQIGNTIKEKVSIRVTDRSGRQMETRSNLTSGQIIQFGLEYKPGTYFVSITQGNQRAVLKVIKQ